MGMPGNVRRMRDWLLLLLLAGSPACAQSVADLQAQFDRETDSVRKAKLLIKLGDAQFDATRRAGKAGDNDTVGFTLEKYRDNVRAAVDALKKQHHDAEKHSNGYRQLEMHVHKGIREVEEAMIAAPEPYKPPLMIVRGDLVAMDEEL
ncbi:MAG TPA: hypothetical protein VE263_21470, partial [Candidatus Angelobacter sp.]|nr:hypothetical protein [Candidatus Angelobacter sp.]